METIDLYQLHRIDAAVPLAEQLGALTELQQAGKIRHIGLDTVTAEQLEQSLATIAVASVQNRYNLLERESEQVLKICAARQIAFLPWFPLGNGALTVGGDPGSLVADVAHRHNATIGQVALAWLLHRSPVILPTPGTASLTHLDENLDAALIELTVDDMNRLDDAM